MVFGRPTLNTYEAADLDYIAKFNGDNTALNQAFAGIEADINNLQTTTGSSVFEDMTRKGPVSESWPDGVLGAYSLEFSSEDIGNGNLLLKSTNQSNLSIAVINGERRQAIGNLSLDLTGIGLTDGARTVYLGVTTSGVIDMVAQASETQSEVTVPLYKVPLTVSGSGTVFTLQANTTPNRITKTLYWDNTVEQLRQETPQTITTFINDLSSLSAPKAYIPIPYDHYIDQVTVYRETGSGSLVVTFNEGSTQIGTFTTFSSSSTTSFDIGGLSTGFSLDYAYAANRVYNFAFTQASGTSTGVTCIMQVRRAYNAPLYS